jgi:hypothetical protein
MNSEEKFHELSYYTLAQPREYFIHQHTVDAYAAQTADENTKPIKIVFALVGLYLYVEKGFSGREVQLFHMKMAKHKVEWPAIVLPKEKGGISVEAILETTLDVEKDKKIKLWCEEVWNAFSANRKVIIELVAQYGSF